VTHVAKLNNTNIRGVPGKKRQTGAKLTIVILIVLFFFNGVVRQKLQRYVRICVNYVRSTDGLFFLWHGEYRQL